MQDGLSHNDVWAIHQDKRGFMWFGTKDGLNRFDGYTFKIYKHNPDDNFSLSSNVIRVIKEDGSGMLWIGTDGGGVNMFNPFTEKFSRYIYSDRDSNTISNNVIHCIYVESPNIIWAGNDIGLDRIELKTGLVKRFNINNIVWTIVPDSNNILWIGTWASGVFALNKTTNNLVSANGNIEQKFGASSNHVLSIIPERHDKRWLGTGAGLIIYNNDTGFNQIRLQQNGSEPVISCMHKDRAGRLWVGTWAAGIKLILDGTQKIISIVHKSELEFSPVSSQIQSIYEDHQGNIWIATNKGVSMLAKWRKQFHHVSHNNADPKSLPEGEVRSIVESRDGNLWIGTWGGGICKWDIKSEQTINLNIKANLSLTGSIFEDSLEEIWVGTPSHIAGLARLNKYGRLIKQYFYNPHREPGGYQVIIPGNNGESLWLGSWSRGLDKFDKEKGITKHYEYDSNNVSSLAGNRIFSLYEDRNGTLWVGANGLNRLLSNENSFIRYQISDTNKPSGEFIYSMLEDTKGRFWLGTNNGLCLFDREKEIFQRVGEDNGNTKIEIYGILEDESDRLWLNSSIGLIRFDCKNEGMRNYGPSDGYSLTGITFTQFAYNGYTKLRSGELAFGGADGFVRFHPDSIYDNPEIPSIVVTSCNKETQLDTSITVKQFIDLPYSENNISFEFASLDYTYPKKNQYAYMLEGMDKEWIYSGTRRYVSYSNLSPGEYIFRVKGSNNDGVWNEGGVSIILIISPPWWKTVWAYLIYFSLFVSGLYGIRRYELSRITLKNRLQVNEIILKQKEEADKVKSNFFANISHEFRTPLTLILGPVEKIISRTSEDSIKDAIIIERNSRRLLQLTNQLLDLSKLEAGKLKLEVSHGNIVSFVKGIVMSFESLLESKDITLIFSADKEVIDLYFDKDKMMKILTNIISNAYKFTPIDGKIKISVNSDQHSNVEIKVRDTGIGIPEAEIPKLFNRFYQVDSSFTKEFEGTGIGLALTKELVELQHGKISVTSKYGEWTEFVISIPIGRNHFGNDEILEDQMTKHEINKDSVYVPLNDFEESNDEASQDKTIVLVVEDNYDMRKYIKESLEINYHIEEAVNGEQAVRKAEKIIPDLIISDLLMPKMDGNALVRIIKGSEKTSHIPIILLTAKADREYKLEGLETGADDYLTKPFDIKELQIRIKNLISIRKNLQDKFGRLSYSSPKIGQKLSNIDENFILKIKEIIEKHISEEHFNTEAFGEELGMSRMQLHRKLKALTGKSAIQFIRSYKLFKSIKMIEEKKLTISEIAYSLGFGSPAYFTKCFKDEFGYPPSEAIPFNQKQ